MIVVAEEKEDTGSLPTPDALTTHLQDHVLDYTRGDAELPYQVRKIYPAGPPAYTSPDALDTGQEILLTLLLHPAEHKLVCELLVAGMSLLTSDGVHGAAHLELYERLRTAGLLQA